MLYPFKGVTNNVYIARSTSPSNPQQDIIMLKAVAQERWGNTRAEWSRIQ